MFINDIVKEIHSNIRLFADDTSLYIIVDFPDSAAQILNLDLERLYNWAVQWLVKFNPIKTESLLFSRRVNLRDHLTLFFNDVTIQEVVSHKHLGVYLSQRCDWQKHIDFIKEKAWSQINLLRMLKFTINRKSLETIYFAYIRSLLEYADVLWDNCTQQQCNEIEKNPTWSWTYCHWRYKTCRNWQTLQRAWMVETLWEKGSSQIFLILQNESWFIASLFI